jgi:hypothetical protein
VIYYDQCLARQHRVIGEDAIHSYGEKTTHFIYLVYGVYVHPATSMMEALNQGCRNIAKF